MTSVPVQIRFADVDLARHVHNSVYLHWFELARMALLQQVVPADHDWTAQGLILARNEVDYRMPVRLHDTIVAEAWCSAVGTKSFDLNYRIVRSGGPMHGLCAEGRSVMVCFDYHAERPIAIPPPWLQRLRATMLP
jgi:acyl-CoA thioester hydrolase